MQALSRRELHLLEWLRQHSRGRAKLGDFLHPENGAVLLRDEGRGEEYGR